MHYLPILLAVCIAINGNTSSAALHPFNDIGAISNANAEGRGRSNVNGSVNGNGNGIGQSIRHASPLIGSTTRRRIRRRSFNDNAAIAAQSVEAPFIIITVRREQEDGDESTSSAAPSTAPSEAGSFTTTTATTSVDTTAISTAAGVDVDNNDNNEATMTATGSTMAEEVPGDNGDNDTDVITAATNLTSSSSSSMNTISPSISPPMTSMETLSNATTATDTSVTTLDEDENDEGGTTTYSPTPSDVSFSTSTTSPSNINGSASGGEESMGKDDNDDEGEGTESLGVPVIHDFSNVPTPSSTGDDGNWIDDHINSNDVDDYYYEQQQGSFEPTPSTGYYNGNGNDDLYGVVETIWEELHTPSPTVVYVPPPSEEDPLSEKGSEEVVGAEQGVGSGDEGDDSKNNGDDNVLYHGLGGKVGTYMDSIESPTEMEHDKNVQIVTATLLSIFIVTLLITAHLVMHHPDGLCAGFCRLALRFIGCVSRTLCLPCRAVCCSGGSEQSRSRRSHAPMRTPFPSDLELT